MVATETVFYKHAHPHYQDSKGVQEAIKEKLSGRTATQGHTDWIDHNNPGSHKIGIEVKNYIEPDQQSTDQYPEPFSACCRVEENAIIIDTRRLPEINQGQAQTTKNNEAIAQ